MCDDIKALPSRVAELEDQNSKLLSLIRRVAAVDQCLCTSGFVCHQCEAKKLLRKCGEVPE